MTEIGTLTLTQFLLARIAEDETLAKSTALHFDAHLAGWAVATGAAVTFNGLPHARIAQAAGSSPGQVAEHIARHDPARVLAECEAKRRQITHLVDFMEGDYAPWNETQLQIMASVYADHPDYRQEWTP